MRIQTMHKVLVTVLLMVGTFIIAAPVSRVTNFIDGQILTASQLNTEFNNVIGGVNSINNSQIATNAQIAPSKIAATIKGDAIERNGSTGALSVKTDNTTVEISGDNIQIKDDGVTNTKIANDAVDTDQLATGAVTTAKIEDAAVTPAKLAARNLVESTAVNSFSTTNTSLTDVTNLSVSITTTGRPVFIGMISSSTSTTTTGMGLVSISSNNNTALGGLWFLRGSSVITNFRLAYSTQGSAASTSYENGCSNYFFIETPSAGTHTYKVQARIGTIPGVTSTVRVESCKLVAYEL